jgi:hypothetical protein
MYQLQRVFLATPWELEAERLAFHDVIGEVNERDAMKRGVLYVPVTLFNIRDKRAYQYVVDENVRDSTYYVLAASDGWGPPERHFEHDYKLALACRQDPALPMRDTAFLRRKPAPDSLVPDELPGPTHEFTTTDEFKVHTRALLTEWLTAASV